MPRVYKSKPGAKRYKKYDEVILKKAVKELSSNSKTSIQNVANKYNISKSVLYRHYKRPMKHQGGQPTFCEETERYICDKINVCTDWGYEFDTEVIRNFIKIYLDTMGVTQKKFKDNMPGVDFAYGFLKRNRVMLRKPKFCIRRTVATKESILKYYAQLKQSLEDVPVDNILSYKEISLCIDSNRGEILMERSTKYPKVLDCSESITVMIAATGTGDMLPPYVVYQSTHFYDNWTCDGPEGAEYNRTQSGCIDGTTFIDWFRRIVVPYFKNRPGKKCLIGENITTHLSIDLVESCLEDDISFFVLPTNSPKYTQPMHNALFLPIKNSWQEILADWRERNALQMPCVPKSCFPKLLKVLIEDLKHCSRNIPVGFRKAGVSPLDSRPLLSRLRSDVTRMSRKSELKRMATKNAQNKNVNRITNDVEIINHERFKEEYYDWEQEITVGDTCEIMDDMNCDVVIKPNYDAEETNCEILKQELTVNCDVEELHSLPDDCFVFIVE